MVKVYKGTALGPGSWVAGILVGPDIEVLLGFVIEAVRRLGGL